MSAGVEIVPGSRVTLHLSLTLADGTEALSTFGEEPLTLVVGDGTLQPGLELALYGMRAGDTETLRLRPDQAYGWPDPEQVHAVPRSDFPAPDQVTGGQVIGFALPTGEEVAGTVLEVGETMVQVDFNHPLAGHEIVMTTEVLAVQPPRAAHEETE
ncbi:MAG: FKBP-type peptidyl-prolyl cis-trans isomerase [Gammaproteobacteria bacterium]|jgi:FKBP-type peptidyl-prolyl cis-trans isomerase SlpA